MKSFLLYKNKDYKFPKNLPEGSDDLERDLELKVLFDAMAKEDDFILKIVRNVVLSSENNSDTIRYRQAILQDCFKNPKIIRQLYQIPIDSIEKKRGSWLSIFTRYPSGILSSAVRLMKMQLGLLKQLRKIADTYSQDFESEGMVEFFRMIQNELNDSYFSMMETHLKNLEFRDGAMISAKLGKGNEGNGYVLRLQKFEKGKWLKRLIFRKPLEFSFTLSPRDEAGGRMLSDIRDRGINLVANAIAQSAEHIDDFFEMLQIEIAFYIGCLNLREQLDEKQYPTVIPELEPLINRAHTFSGMYDVCLALTNQKKVVGNDLNANRGEIFLITGANQGGKTTFLRSIGIAQLMMQAGMFVGADSFCANLSDGIFTHFRRQEDTTMESGKLDEELTRMSEIIDRITPNSLLLFNESFTTTNEKEGSEIARQITDALLEKRIKIFFVTHMYDYVNSYLNQRQKKFVFLQAERKSDGERTFRMVDGSPTQTSYGKDVFLEVFDSSSDCEPG